MSHNAEWKVRLNLSEDEGGTTKARVVLDTGTKELSGQGIAHKNPVDPDIPEIGDELAAGRALHDLGRRLVDVAQHDIEGMDAAAGRQTDRTQTGWPLLDEKQGR